MRAVPATVTRSHDMLWQRWVAANAGAEAVGLGLTALVAYLLFRSGEPSGAGALAAALALVVAGSVEGLCVGAAQWSVLHRVLPRLAARRWIGATIIGAVVAWSLGLLPSLAAGGQATGDGAAQAFDGPAQYLLAAAMGAVAGPILGGAQWWVLRSFVPGAGWWILANSLAWAAGMPLIFAVAGGVPAGIGVAGVVVLVLVTLALAGAVVGAVHGAVLVRLLAARPQ
jgi:hypothetical protein